jgi:O-antigen/teichoic acid export membrane protein
LKSAYLRTLEAVSFASIPFAGGIFVLAPDFTLLFLGEKWTSMIPAMRVLALWGLVRSVGANAGPFYRAIGRPDLGPKVQAVQVSLLAILIYPLTMKWGILGTAAAVALSGFLVFPLNAFTSIRVVNCKASEYFSRVAPPVFMTLLMVAVLCALRTTILPATDVFSLLALVASGTIVYTCSVLLAERAFGYRVRGIFLSIARSLARHAT